MICKPISQMNGTISLTYYLAFYSLLKIQKVKKTIRYSTSLAEAYSKTTYFKQRKKKLFYIKIIISWSHSVTWPLASKTRHRSPSRLIRLIPAAAL